MEADMREILVIVLLATFAPNMQAQQHQTRDWYCVRQAFAETPDGDVVVLQCVAALPKNEKLDVEDEDILGKLERIRWNTQTFTGKGDEMIDAMRMCRSTNWSTMPEASKHRVGTAFPRFNFWHDNTLRV
jgi:hypothetical protein